MSVMNIISLLGGLSLFLFGMKVLGEGLERAAGNRLKKILGIVTHNRVLAMLAGVVITAVIQSSSATTVMVVGFVNAGLLCRWPRPWASSWAPTSVPRSHRPYHR